MLLKKRLRSLGVKVLMVILVLTFVLWGISDIFNSSSSRTALKVGNIEYSAPQLQAMLYEKIHKIEKRLGSSMSTPELSQIALAELIDEIILKQEIEGLKLLVSDEIVKYEIVRIPTFLDGNGKFDKNKFEQILLNFNLSEEQFIEDLKYSITKNNLLKAFVTNKYLPQSLIDQILYGTYLKREIELFEVSNKKIVRSLSPTKEELKNFLNTNKESFEIPESRNISYVIFDTKMIKNDVEISYEELHQEYRNKLALFFEPEKREVQQLIISSYENAIKAANIFKTTNQWVKEYEELGAKKTDFGLGIVSKDMFENNISDLIFSLKANEVSEPIQSPLGWHIFRVNIILSEHTKTFDEVESFLKDELTKKKQQEALNLIVKEVSEDIERGSIRDLSSLSAQYNLQSKKAKIFQELDKASIDSNINEPELRKLAFTLSTGELSNVISVGDSKFIVVQIDGINPKTNPTLEDVADNVKEAWFEKKSTKLSDKIAKDLRAILTSNGNLLELKKYLDIHSITIDRFNYPKSIPSQLLEEIFTLSIGSVSSAVQNTDGNYMIAKLKFIHEAEDDKLKQNSQQIVLGLSQVRDEALLHEYMRHLKTKYPVVIDHSLLQNNIKE